ncbi:MAG TPA: hypothetical protein PLF54_04755 [Deltaproteobacteria bacterium]|nr:hypothetical protein [Deltaproteobacteria bacterium]
MKGYPPSSRALLLTALALIAVILNSARAFAAEITFVPMLSLREEYNDNVLFDSTNGDEIDDWITTVSPGARLTGRTENLDASLQTRFDILKYSRTDDLDETDQDYSGSATCEITERLRASAQARMIEDSRSDRDIETTGLVLGTEKRHRRQFGTSADYAVSEKAVATLSYSYYKETFDDPEFDDSTGQDANLGINCNLGSLVALTTSRLNVGYALYKFPDTRITSYSMTIGASKQFNDYISLSADIGQSLTRSTFETTYWIFTYEERGKERGTIGNLALTYADELTKGTITLYRNISALSGDTGTVRRTSVRLDVTRRFTYEFRGRLTAEIYKNRAVRGELASEDVDEQTLRVQPTLTYSLTNDLTLNASYRYTRLKDYEEDKKNVQNLYYLVMSWQYPIPH